MEALIQTFHVDVKLLVAQLVNFGIVFFVLYRFAYRPLLSKMNERTAKIEQGLEDAKKANTELQNAEKVREEKVILAKKEAKQIIADAQKMAEKNKAEMVAQSQEQTKKVIEEAKQQISYEKEKMLREVKQEVGALVALATEKLIDEKMTDEKDQGLINKVLADIKK